MSAVPRMRMISVLSLATMSAGVPGGARIPCHDPVSNPGTPDSATVGTSGREDIRVAPETARSLRLPLFTCELVADALGRAVAVRAVGEIADAPSCAQVRVSVVRSVRDMVCLL